MTLYHANLATVTISSNQAEFGEETSAESVVITITSLPSSPFHSLVLSNNTAINGDDFYLHPMHIKLYQLDPRPHSITVRLTHNSAQIDGAI